MTIRTPLVSICYNLVGEYFIKKSTIRTPLVSICYNNQAEMDM